MTLDDHEIAVSLDVHFSENCSRPAEMRGAMGTLALRSWIWRWHLTPKHCVSLNNHEKRNITHNDM